jgi:uncharacterized membrane protein
MVTGAVSLQGRSFFSWQIQLSLTLMPAVLISLLLIVACQNAETPHTAAVLAAAVQARRNICDAISMFPADIFPGVP